MSQHQAKQAQRRHPARLYIDSASYKGALVLGAPSIIGAWAHNLVRDAAAAMTPPLDVRLLDKLDDVGPEEEWSRTHYFTQFPSAPAISIIESGRMPVVAFLDEARDAVSRSSNCTFIEALRVGTCGAVANRALLHAETALVVRRNYSGPASALIDKILDHIGMRIPAEASKAIKLKYLGSALGASTLEDSLQRDPFYRPPGKWSNELSSAEATVVDEVLKPMVLMALQEECLPIRWSHRVFLSGDRPNEPAPLVTEVAGAARNIYYGLIFICRLVLCICQRCCFSHVEPIERNLITDECGLYAVAQQVKRHALFVQPHQGKGGVAISIAVDPLNGPESHLGPT